MSVMQAAWQTQPVRLADNTPRQEYEIQCKK